jgi:hypothetical protein
MSRAGTVREPRGEVGVLELHRHRARGELVAPQIGGGLGGELAQRRRQLVRLLDVARERGLTAQLPRRRARLHRRGVDAAHPGPEPLGGAAAEPPRERGAVVRQHVLHAHEPERRELRLHLGPDPGDLGEREAAEELALPARRDHAHAVAPDVGPGLRALGGELGHQLGRAAADGDPHARLAMDRLADAPRGALERLVVVERLGAREVEVPLIDARTLDDRREAGEHRGDGAGGRAAGLARHRHAERVRTEADGLVDRHRGAHAVGPRLVGGGADDPPPTRAAPDDQQRCASRALGIRHARDGDEERIGIGEEDAALMPFVDRGAVRHPGSIEPAGAGGYIRADDSVRAGY